MDDEQRQEIEQLKAQVAALRNERLPRVDRASKRRDRRQVLGGLGLFAVAVLLAGTVSASALSGTNTVDSGDIKDGEVHNADLGADSVTAGKVKNGALAGADIKDSSLTGADIDESSLALPKIYTTAVSASGQTVFGAGTATSTTTTGFYNVDYGFTVTGCTAQAGPGYIQGTVPGNTVDTGANAATSLGAVGAQTVTVFMNKGGTGTSSAFIVTLTCP